MRTLAPRIIPPPVAPVLIVTALRAYQNPKLASRFQHQPTTPPSSRLDPATFNTADSSKQMTPLKTLPVPRVGSNLASFLHSVSNKI